MILFKIGFFLFVLLGIQPLYGDIKFSPNSTTTVNGNNGGNAVGWFPAGGTYFVYSASSELKFGLSLYGNFGSVLDYDEEWVGRYYLKKATLLGMTVAPAIGYRINELFSVGASFNAMYAILSEKVAVNNSPFGFFDRQDGQAKVKDNTWGYGGTFGILFEPTQCTRFGLTYITQMKLDFESPMQFEGGVPNIIPGGSFWPPLTLRMTVPQSAMAFLFRGRLRHQFCFGCL